MKKIIIVASILAMFSMPALADAQSFELVIKDHKFTPDLLEVPAGQKIKLLIKNQDSTPEEFESHDFNREKVISGNSEGVVFVGPLEAGEYKFFGEFHEKTAQGKLVVK